MFCSEAINGKEFFTMNNRKPDDSEKSEMLSGNTDDCRPIIYSKATITTSKMKIVGRRQVFSTTYRHRGLYATESNVAE